MKYVMAGLVIIVVIGFTLMSRMQDVPKSGTSLSQKEDSSKISSKALSKDSGKASNKALRKKSKKALSRNSESQSSSVSKNSSRKEQIKESSLGEQEDHFPLYEGELDKLADMYEEVPTKDKKYHHADLSIDLKQSRKIVNKLQREIQ